MSARINRRRKARARRRLLAWQWRPTPILLNYADDLPLVDLAIDNLGRLPLTANDDMVDALSSAIVAALGVPHRLDAPIPRIDMGAVVVDERHRTVEGIRWGFPPAEPK